MVTVGSVMVAVVMVVGGCSRRMPVEPPEVSVVGLDPVLGRMIEERRGRVMAEGGSGRAWGALGQVLDAAEFGVEAARCYARAEELEPTEARWPHLLGLRQMAEEFERGVASLERAVRLVGTNQDAPRLRLAQALLERGRTGEAKVPLRALLAIRPEHPAARLELARAEFAEGDWAEAAVWLGPCLTNPFTARPAGLLLSQVRAREGRGEVAQELARRASGLPKPFDWPDPFVQEVQALRSDRGRLAEKVGALMVQRRFEEAEELLGELMARAPEDAEVLLLSGRWYLGQRRCAEAEQRFRKSLEVEPDSLNGLIQLGLALLCQQRWMEATGVLERAVGLKPDFAQAHANLGVAYSRMGDGVKAIRAYEEALRCSPGEAGYHASLGEEMMRVGRREEAKRHLDRALELDPRQARARGLVERWEGR